jgi:catechol 2,3-dioxygenase-like lactoylglutathione lyase family enzyme
MEKFTATIELKPMSENIGIETIGQISIGVTDIDRSVTFYRDTLGLPLLFQADPGMAFLDCAGIRLMLTLPLGHERDHHTSVIYYRVPNIHAAVRSMKDNGVEMEREPQLTARMEDHELWIAFLRDPDSNLVALMAEEPLG